MSVSCQVEREAELISKYSRRNGLGYSEQVTQAQLDRAGTGLDSSSKSPGFKSSFDYKWVPINTLEVIISHQS